MSDDYILEMIDIQKEFPGVKALQSATLKVRNREIHGLVGENGAGKSTLMKVLAGLYTQDSGEIKFQGNDYKNLTPRLVEKLGIHFIHQERQVVPHLTVAESLFLGIEPVFSPFKLLNRRSLEKEAEKVLKEKVGFIVPGDKLIGELTVGEQQLIQISRALLHDPKLIVFDEPTAVLAKKEADKLFEIIREISKSIGIIYISHYFGEILELCNRVTVIRNGTNVDTVNSNEVSIEDLVFLMVGRKIEEQFPVSNRKKGSPLLEVKNLTHKKQFRNVSFTVHSGEILGITGLMGSGHTDLGDSIYDNSSIFSGTIEFEGENISKISPEKAVKLGMGYVPEDRRNLGIVQNMSVRENITLACIKKLSKKGLIKFSEENTTCDELINKLEIRTPGRETAVGSLSGGNQQKVVISKWLSNGSKLYILNQPTSGVDIGAKTEIYSLINKMAEEGAGILLISQDIQEVVGLSDRILVMYRGGIKEEFKGDKHIEDQVIVSMMGGEKNGRKHKKSKSSRK